MGEGRGVFTVACYTTFLVKIWKYKKIMSRIMFVVLLLLLFKGNYPSQNGYWPTPTISNEG